MRVQVGVEEGEEGEFGDGLHFARIGVDGPRGQPEPVAGVHGHRLAAQHLQAAVERARRAADDRQRFERLGAGVVPGVADDRRLRQIAQQQRQGHGDESGDGGFGPDDLAERPQRSRKTSEVWGQRRHQTPGNAEHPQTGHAEQHRQGQVIGQGGDDAQQFGQRAHEDEAEVVVVDVAAGVPRVVGREGGGAHDGREIGQVHRLLAAPDNVPHVRVAQPDADHDQEQGHAQQLDQQDVAGSLVDERPQLLAPAPGDGRADAHERRQRQQDRPARIGQELDARRQPRQIRYDQQPQHPRQRVAPVGQAAQGHEGQREGRPAQQQ